MEYYGVSGGDYSQRNFQLNSEKLMRNVNSHNKSVSLYSPLSNPAQVPENLRFTDTQTLTLPYTRSTINSQL